MKGVDEKVFDIGLDIVNLLKFLFEWQNPLVAL
jgi:hypothetical protein